MGTEASAIWVGSAGRPPRDRHHQFPTSDELEPHGCRIRHRCPRDNAGRAVIVEGTSGLRRNHARDCCVPDTFPAPGGLASTLRLTAARSRAEGYPMSAMGGGARLWDPAREQLHG